VNGGREHLLSFHGPEGEVTAAGPAFEAQTSGTYAGQDVRYAARIEGAGIGNSYLTNVRHCAEPPAYWTTTWNVAPRWIPKNIQSPVGLRLHHLTNDIHDVAMCDNPNPSQRSVVQTLTYVLQHRFLASQSSASLSSTFVTVLEPFAGATFIREIRRIPTDLPDAVALEVTLADGIVDTLLSSSQPGTRFRTETGWSCDAAFAHVRTRQGRIESITSIQGSLVESSAVRHVSDSAWRGTVLDFDSRTSEHTTFVTELALPTKGQLNGETVVFDTDADIDAAYRIHDVSRKGSLYRVSVGRDSFALGYRDASDVSRGFRYAIAKGTSFSIANHKQT